MTLYEYRCPVGEPIEDFFSFGHAPEVIWCPDHSALAKRVITAPAVKVVGGTGANYKRRD